MSAFALLLFALYALLEIAVATAVAALIGWGWTFVLVAVFVVVGAAVMRRAGLAAARSLTEGTQGGRVVPAVGTGAAVGDASMQFVAGVLIAIPGFVTTALGLLMLIPPVRRLLGVGLVGWVMTRVRRGGMSVVTTYDSQGRRTTRVYQGDVGEGEVVPDEPGPAAPPRALED